ncbi:3-hydroxyacyl-CoA dehydrogenase NAD-binding domain-containing protein [Spongiibacter sp.]|uniref:3-hydroxyacyl-CoA dehydrogenase NAD-binding domain-containing protein n=1 Tax=Spongiibacter sp. TaxID=2024860 RepID=UPI001B19E6B8|nr:3-hydroxyacyl-CoA dehydrogenase NAD-binding domain-containing protein [Spongiibacter sp.]MBO6753324.1 enoyl-CoA hydratase/isomerase family protein [Spongiibacter sp.]|tara:strand:- start:7826 stop:9934 length:2109 start_codon:yes stop_codon:yes gene_type:complete
MSAANPSISLESASYQIIDGIAVTAINNPPINAISAAVRRSLLAALKKAEEDGASLLMIYCEGNTYIAGADISEFGKPQDFPQLPDVVAAIENATIPVMVAMHGNALGGGLEIAMAGHYRSALSGTKLGLPEVKLGILPGSGGTQRLPRLVGAEKALAMILEGKSISAEEALQAGLIDRTLDGDLRESALSYARELVQANASTRRTGQLSVENPAPELFAAARAKQEKSRSQLLAPNYIIDLIEAATCSSIELGQKLERERFVECRASSGSQSLRHLFFAERTAAKPKGIGNDIPPRSIDRVAVIGAGTMGGGIAMCFATAGYAVTLVELSSDNLQRGLGVIQGNYQKAVDRGITQKAIADEAFRRITGTTDIGNISDADLVVEATFESMDVKSDVFAKLDAICKPGAILATNTSYLDINEIANMTSRPQDVVGAHFFSPAHIMKLLEVVRSDKTAPDVIKTLMQVAKRIGKIPVTVGVCYGFVGNRMLQKYARQAQLLLIEGATPAQVDNAIKSWGMAMGPLSVADLAGLDIGYFSRRNQGIEVGSQPECSVPDELVDEKRLGRKTLAGFYGYDAVSGTQFEDDYVVEKIKSHSSRWGITRRAISDDEIVDRLILALVIEGIKILEEGVADRSSDIDVVYVNGYGFPRWRGGPMFYAETIGLENALQRIRQFQQQTLDDFWEPPTLLIKAAEQGSATLAIR